MKSLISGDKFVWKGQPWHQITFFQPKNGAKRPREENSLNGSKCNNSFMEGFLLVHPVHRPLSFFSDHINVLNRIEKEHLLILVLNVSVYQEGVCFWVYIFHSNLEAIKASCLGYLNFWAELLREIFHNDSVTGGEECEDIFDEMFFVRVQFLPISEVLSEIDFVCSPEWCQMLFVHIIDGWVVNGKEDESMVVLIKDRLGCVW